MHSGRAEPMRLAAAEREAAVQMLTRAFDDDPLLRHLLPEAPARPRLLARSFRSMVRYGLVYGEVHATSAELEGVAVWLPAEYSHATLWRMARTGVLALVPDGRPRFLLAILVVLPADRPVQRPPRTARPLVPPAPRRRSGPAAAKATPQGCLSPC